mgnify:CR=1 FL=1
MQGLEIVARHPIEEVLILNSRCDFVQNIENKIIFIHIRLSCAI